MYAPRQDGEWQQPLMAVYMLPGLGGDEMVRFQDDVVTDAVDRLSDETGVGVLLVGIDGRTSYGSEYLASEASPWFRFLSRDLISAIDSEFGTGRTARHRALVGHSTGGFNAIRIALDCPGVFGSIGASAPDALDLDAWLLTRERSIRTRWISWMRLEDALGGPGQMVSFAQSWSADREGGFEWPVDLATGETKESVLDKWLRQSPMRRIVAREAQEALMSLSGRLVVSATSEDEFGLFEPSRRFCQGLARLGIKHEFVVDKAGHFDAQQRVASIAVAVLRAAIGVSGTTNTRTDQ
ncbi:MAG: alpha/beta fold hydrolase [Vicinamibacterales bacterium]